MNEFTLSYINKYDPLPAEEEKALAYKVREGDAKARDKLILSNIRFVIQVAKKYVGQGLDLEDLVSEGQYGLIKAVDKYDPDRGYRLLTYAVWWIRQSILLALANQGALIRLPMHAISKKQQIHRATQELEQKLKRPPSLEEVQKKLDFDIDVLAYLSIISLDQKLNDTNKTEIGDLVDDVSAINPDTEFMQRALEEDIKKALSQLSDRELEIIRLYYGLNSRPFTLEEIGAVIGRTRERVRQIKENVLYKLKKTGQDTLKPHLEK